MWKFPTKPMVSFGGVGYCKEITSPFLGELPNFHVRFGRAKGTVSVLSVLGGGLLIALGEKKTGGFQAVYIYNVRPPSYKLVYKLQ